MKKMIDLIMLICLFLTGVFIGHYSFALTARQIYSKVAMANGHYFFPLYKTVKTKQVNAYSYTYKIVFTTGMYNFVKNEDELAAVVGHELAHRDLHHDGSTPDHEYAADKLGMELMEKAGFNRCIGAKLYKRLNSPGSNTHPSSINRYNKVKCRGK